MKRMIALALFNLIVLSDNSAIARDASRDLKKLVGYTIVAADSISEVATNNHSDKYLKLYNGWAFKVDFLLLDPLVMTDVIVFAKPLPDELTGKFKEKLPDHMLYSYKLLIDNEIYDATPQ